MNAQTTDPIATSTHRLLDLAHLTPSERHRAADSWPPAVEFILAQRGALLPSAHLLEPLDILPLDHWVRGHTGHDVGLGGHELTWATTPYVLLESLVGRYFQQLSRDIAPIWRGYHQLIMRWGDSDAGMALDLWRWSRGSRSSVGRDLEPRFHHEAERYLSHHGYVARNGTPAQRGTMLNAWWDSGFYGTHQYLLGKTLQIVTDRGVSRFEIIPKVVGPDESADVLVDMSDKREFHPADYYGGQVITINWAASAQVAGRELLLNGGMGRPIYTEVGDYWLRWIGTTPFEPGFVEK